MMCVPEITEKCVQLPPLVMNNRLVAMEKFQMECCNICTCISWFEMGIWQNPS